MTNRCDISVDKRFSAVMSTCSILSAILVVWIHAYNVEMYSDTNRVIYWLQDAISQGIARGAVPFFLMSSAFFLYSKDKNVWDVYQSRTKSVLIPYLLWNTVYMVILTVLHYLSLVSIGMDVITVGNVAQGIFLNRYNYTYWFMRDLIVLVVFYPLIRWIISRGKIASLIGMAGLLTAYYCGLKWLGSAVYYYVGAVIGYHFKQYAVNAVAMKKKWKISAFLACVCVAGVLFWVKNVCKVDAPELFRDLAMAFVLFFAVVSFDIHIRGVFATLSFMIYSLHPLILEMVEKIIYLYCPHTDLWMVIDYMVAPIITMGIIAAVCLLWKKILPKVYKVFNGGRS